MVMLRIGGAAALIVGFAVAVAGGGGGDGDKASKIDEPSPAASQSQSNPTVIVEPSKDGEIRYSGETESGEQFKAQIGGEVALPSAFGSDLPSYPGAVIQSAIETTGGTAVAAIESDASVDDVIEFYRDQLDSNEWSVESVDNLGRRKLLAATKGKRRVTVNADRRDQKTRFTLSLDSKSTN